jgi:hypothetical protein
MDLWVVKYSCSKSITISTACPATTITKTKEYADFSFLSIVVITKLPTKENITVIVTMSASHAFNQLVTISTQ